MEAHFRGKLEYAAAMRLVSIISRCYATDLEFLKPFRNGTQREMTPIAESLFAGGLLSQTGFDGGELGDPLSAGTTYALNEYGVLSIRHALS